MVQQKKPIRLGPFVGGLNNSSDPSTIADAETEICINLEVEIDGSLKNRPPIRLNNVTRPTNDDNTWVMIGSSIYNGLGYVFASSNNGNSIVYNGSSWNYLGAGGLNTVYCVEYDDKTWCIPSSNTPGKGGYWNPTTNWTQVADIPIGVSGVIHKNRLFIIQQNNSRLIFSEPGDFTSWPSANFIDISPGDGEVLNCIQVYNDNLILFKTNSTYVLAYDVFPSEAILRQVSSTVGASNSLCVQQYQNILYTLHDYKVYEIVNYDFTDITVKMNFVYDLFTPPGTTRLYNKYLTLLGDRLLARFYNKLYSFNLLTRTWSEWKSEDIDLNTIGFIIKYPDITSSNTDLYIGGSSLDKDRNMFEVSSVLDTINSESSDIVCTVKTKTLSLANPLTFKRLFWWGADILSNTSLTATVQPVVVSFVPTWGDLASYAWEDLNSWAQPISGVPPIKDTVTFDGRNARKFIKLPKALRFREINFTLEIPTNGNLTKQVQIFTLEILVGTRALVTDKVS